MDMFINQTGGILSQYIHVSDYRDVHFKYLTILYVNYNSMKLKFKNYFLNGNDNNAYHTGLLE